MRLLLDTHIFIWWDSDPDRLTSTARDLLEDPANALLLSVASVWEMQIKHQLGKLQFNKPLPKLIRDQQRKNGVTIRPVRVSHVYALAALPHHHKDPFDRLLIAQAQTENAALVTADPVFQQYSVPVYG